MPKCPSRMIPRNVVPHAHEEERNKNPKHSLTCNAHKVNVNILRHKVHDGNVPPLPILRILVAKKGKLKFSRTFMPNSLELPIAMSEYPENTIYKFNHDKRT